MQRLQSRLDRWARGHERLALVGFLCFILGVAVWNNAEAWRDGDQRLRIALAATWILGVSFTAVVQLVRWRQGRLMILDPEQRELQRAANLQQRSRWMWPAVGVALGLGALGGNFLAVIMAAFASLILGYTPLLLYIVFIIRPDEQRLPGADPTPRPASPHEPHA